MVQVVVPMARSRRSSLPWTASFLAGLLASALTVPLAGGCADPKCILGGGPCPNGEDPIPGTCDCPSPFPETGTDAGGDTNQPTEGSGASADETGPILDVAPNPPEFGEPWCVRTEGAEYTPDPDSDPASDPLIVYPDQTAPEGCACVPYSSSVQDWLELNKVDDRATIDQLALEAQLGIGNPLIADLLALREEIYTAAVTECLDIAPIPNQGTTCADATIFDAVPATPEFEPVPISLGNRFGETECLPPPQGFVPRCSFADDVSRIPINDEFFLLPRHILDGFVDDPHCLLLQGWTIGIDEQGSFLLGGIDPGDMLDTLGLRNGDELLLLESGGQTYDLTDPARAIDAYHVLRREVLFELEISRAGALERLGYISARREEGGHAFGDGAP